MTLTLQSNLNRNRKEKEEQQMFAFITELNRKHLRQSRVWNGILLCGGETFRIHCCISPCGESVI